MIEILLVLIFLAVLALAAAVIWLIATLVRRIETLDMELEESHRREFSNLLEISRLKNAHYALTGDLADAHFSLELVLNDKEPA